MNTYEDLRSKLIAYLQQDDPERQITIGRPFAQLLQAIADVIDERMEDPYRSPAKHGHS